MRNRQNQLKLGVQQTKARSASYQIVGSASGESFSNTGATGAVTLTLPKTSVGQEYWFYVSVAQSLVVASAAPDIIGTKGAGASYASATIGSFLWVKCFVLGKWTLAINSGFV